MNFHNKTFFFFIQKMIWISIVKCHCLTLNRCVLYIWHFMQNSVLCTYGWKNFDSPPCVKIYSLWRCGWICPRIKLLAGSGLFPNHNYHVYLVISPSYPGENHRLAKTRSRKGGSIPSNNRRWCPHADLQPNDGPWWWCRVTVQWSLVGSYTLKFAK